MSSEISNSADYGGERDGREEAGEGLRFLHART